MKKNLKKLPIGISTFSEIIEQNYLYIDKTKEAYELITSYKHTFPDFTHQINTNPIKA